MRYEHGLPVPTPTPTSLPFWAALREHRIEIQFSPSSNEWIFYPRVRAPKTLADDLEWREISGLGTIYTFTIASRPTAPPWADSVPQRLAVVEWDEGPKFTTEMVEGGPELHIGQRVEPVFVDIAGSDVTLLKYRAL